MTGAESYPQTVVYPFAPWPTEWESEGTKLEFKLVYQGPLPAESRGGSSRVQVKHAIRREIHKQLRHLWNTHPFIAKYAEQRERARKIVRVEWQGQVGETSQEIGPPWRSVAEQISYKYRRCGYHFVPLVGGAFGDGSETACALDILFLRREAPGHIIKSGDIDNRIKTLLDGLQMPENCAKLPGPDADEFPFFILLENDNLITEVRITTDQLLTPLGTDEHIHDVYLVIHVKTLAIGPAFADIGIPSALETQRELSNTYAAHESRLSQLQGEGDAIRADVNQDKEKIQKLIDENVALRADLDAIIDSDAKTARTSLEINDTLRNKVLFLVAELREINGRVKFVGEYPKLPEAPIGLHVSSSMLNEHRRKVVDFEGRQRWKQVWDIYHSDFAERVKAIVGDLQRAKVASDKLIAFPENLGVDELDHALPFSIGNKLIPELLSAAEALVKGQPS